MLINIRIRFFIVLLLSFVIKDLYPQKEICGKISISKGDNGIFSDEKPRVYIISDNEVLAFFANADGSFNAYIPKYCDLKQYQSVTLLDNHQLKQQELFELPYQSIELAKVEDIKPLLWNKELLTLKMKGHLKSLLDSTEFSTLGESVLIHIYSEDTLIIPITDNLIGTSDFEIDIEVDFNEWENKSKLRIVLIIEKKSLFVKLKPITLNFNSIIKDKEVNNYSTYIIDTITIDINRCKIKYIESMAQRSDVLNKIQSYSFVPKDTIEIKDEPKYSETVFYKKIEFNAVIFPEEVSFKNSHFTKFVSFDGAIFKKPVSFFGVQFFGGVSFKGTQFMDSVDFSFAHFNSDADFSDAKFYNDVSFQFARMPKFLNFCNLEIIDKEIDLTYLWKISRLNLCNIKLFNTDIDKINLMYVDFLLDFECESFLQQYNKKDIESTIYQKLLTKTNEKGYLLSYEKLDKEFREFKYLEIEGGIWGVTKNIFSKLWWGYGYEKWRIFYNILIIFVILSFFSNFYVKYLNPLNVNGKIEKSFNSIRTSVVNTAIIFFALEYNLKSLKAKDNENEIPLNATLFFLFTYLTGLICLGYLLNFFVTTGPKVFN